MTVTGPETPIKQFGYSALTQINATHLGLLWETTLPDCVIAPVNDCAMFVTYFTLLVVSCAIAGAGEHRAATDQSWRSRFVSLLDGVHTDPT